MRTPTLGFNPTINYRPYWFEFEPKIQKIQYIELDRREIYDGEDISSLEILKDFKEDEDLIFDVTTDNDGDKTYTLIKRQRIETVDPKYDEKMAKYIDNKSKFNERLAQYEFDLVYYNENQKKTAREIEIATLKMLAEKYPEEFAKK